MPVLKNRAYVVTATTGTGTITLGSPVAGYQSFTDAGLTTGAVTRYTIQDGANWEIGLGTYTTSGNTLTRTPSESSNSGSAINLSGNAEVFIAATAEDVSPLYDANFVTQTTSSFLGPNASGTDAVAIGLDAQASGTRSVGIGALATGTNVGAIATGNGAVALGGSNASGTEAFSANNSRNNAAYGSTGANSVTLGYQSRAQATYSVAIGYAAIAGGQYGIALGFSRANGEQSFSIGQNASTASGENTIVIGKAISSSVNNEIAIGGTGNTIKLFDAYTLPTTDGSAGTALVTNGSGALSFSSVGADLYAANPSSATDPTASGPNAVAIGSGASAGQTDSIAIGGTAYVGNSYAVALGYDARVSGGDGGTALGRNSRAAGGDSVAVGKSYSSGTDSFAAVINNNTSSYGATQGYAIAIGQNAKASSTETIAMGVASQATANAAVAIGGGYSEATAQRGMALGSYAKAATIGKFAFSNQRFAAAGDSQGGQFILRADTTDATATVLTTNNSTAASTNQIVAASDTCIMFSGTIVAMQNGAQDQGGWEIKGLLKNDGGTTTLVSSNIQTFSDGNNWTVALSANDTHESLTITCTGEAAHNIRWVANILTSEVTYA